MKRGFTLIEVMIILAVIGILTTIAVPLYHRQVTQSRESVLKKDLHELREQIHTFYLDKKKYPTALEELVTNHYLHKIPEDPIARTTAWELVYNQPVEGETEVSAAEGIIDVKSKAKGKALDGSNYCDW
jgi:general secretion pathway protein G